MSIPLKTLLIFCLVTASTAQTSTNVPISTPTSTTATTVTTEASATTTTGTFTTGTTTGSTDATPVSTTTSTQASATTTTGTFTTGTTTGSTDATPVSTTTSTQATGDTSTGTFNTVTRTDSTDDTSVTAPAPATTTTTTTQGPCASSPCIRDSTCEERFGGLFACICRPGLVYLEMRGCIQTKVFPGSLSLNRTFFPDMEIKNTELFQQTAGGIEETLRSILGDENGYVNSIVLSLREGSVIADVQNFYDLSSNATSASVQEKIDAAISGGTIRDATNFTRGNMCIADICDNTTTEVCEEQEASGNVRCTCKEGYIRSQFTLLSCHPCPNGEMAEGEDSCVKCPFGFTGFNCNDPYLLVVIVVSTVLGALLIIFIVALIVVSCRNQKGSSSSQVDFSSNYGNKELHKPTGVPRIPRANPDANNLEMTDSGSDQALVTRDRPESKARYNDYEDISNRGQIPPAYSGYGGRGVENGGAHNPYFRQDDDRIRRY